MGSTKKYPFEMYVIRTGQKVDVTSVGDNLVLTARENEYAIAMNIGMFHSLPDRICSGQIGVRPAKVDEYVELSLFDALGNELDYPEYKRLRVSTGHDAWKITQRPAGWYVEQKDSIEWPTCDSKEYEGTIESIRMFTMSGKLAAYIGTSTKVTVQFGVQPIASGIEFCVEDLFVKCRVNSGNGVGFSFHFEDSEKCSK